MDSLISNSVEIFYFPNPNKHPLKFKSQHGVFNSPTFIFLQVLILVIQINRYQGPLSCPSDLNQHNVYQIGWSQPKIQEEFASKKEVTDFSLSALVGQVQISEFIANQDGLIDPNQSTHPISAFSLNTTPFTQSKFQNFKKQNKQDESKQKVTPQKKISKQKCRSQKQSLNSNPSQKKNGQLQQQQCSNQTYTQSLSSFEQIAQSNNANYINNLQTNLSKYSFSCNKDESTFNNLHKRSPNSDKKNSHKRRSQKQFIQNDLLTNKHLRFSQCDETTNIQQYNFVNDMMQSHEDHQYALMSTAQFGPSASGNQIPYLDLNQNEDQNDDQDEDMELEDDINNEEREEEDSSDDENENEEDGNEDEEDDDDDEEDEENENEEGGNNNQGYAQKKSSSIKSSKAKSNRTKSGDGERSNRNKKLSEAKPCNCRNSKCLKRYCDCFAAGLYCQAECKCEECHNKPEYEDERQKAIQKKKKRIKDAFQPVILNNTHIKGCHCKNSHCQKKYCVCHQNGVLCSELCQCLECENKISEQLNQEQNKQFSLLQMQQNENIQEYIYQREEDDNFILQQTPSQLQLTKQKQTLLSPESDHNNLDQVGFLSTIKKDNLNKEKSTDDQDFSTHKKLSKRRVFKSGSKQKTLQFFNEISPVDNKYP